MKDLMHTLEALGFHEFSTGRDFKAVGIYTEDGGVVVILEEVN